MKLKTTITPTIIIFIFTIFIEIIYTSAHPLIHEITQEVFDEEVNNNKTLYILFYLESCHYCKRSKESLTKYIEKYSSSSNDMNNIKLTQVECDQNKFFCTRFTVNKVPYIIIIKNKKLYEPDKPLQNEDSIAEFINEDKPIEKGKDIPGSIGIIWFLYINFENFIMDLNKILDGLSKHYINDYVTWSIYHTVGLIVLTLTLIIIIELVILTYCCDSKVKKVKTKLKEISEESKENKDNNKENKDEKVKDSKKENDLLNKKNN